MAARNKEERLTNMLPVVFSGLCTDKKNCIAKVKYIEKYNFFQCAEFSKYEKVTKIGQGALGDYFESFKKTHDKKLFILKTVVMENEGEGFPIAALREIRLLQRLKHENIIKFVEICRTKATLSNTNSYKFFMVFDFCEHDLAGLLSNNNVKFSLGEIKNVMQQLLNGLYYIHRNRILHLDLKTANVLITKMGILKLSEFGLARQFSAPKPDMLNRYMNRSVTLWYLPPEVLLGDLNYGWPVDIWSAGCIMAEMWTRSPIMQGYNETQQLGLITQLCGSITPTIWPDVEKLKLYTKIELPQNNKRKVIDSLKIYVKNLFACDLLNKLLLLHPSTRIDAKTALEHDFFNTHPMPKNLSRMLSTYTKTMFEYLLPTRRVEMMRQHP